MPVLPDKPLSKSWVARGAAAYFGAKILEAFGIVPAGSVDAAVATVQSIDPAQALEAAQGAALAGIAVGFRRVAGQILVALTQVKASLDKPAI